MATFKVIVQEKDLDEATKYLNERIEINLKNDCHLWKLSKHATGYGIGSWKRVRIYTHRLSYAVANGGIIELTNDKGEALEVRHGKDCERHCCNPEHLKIGTHQENANDKIEKGTNHHGEHAHTSTITEDTAKEIIASRYPKDHELYLSRADRASKFGVKISLIDDIDCNNSWKHLTRKPMVHKKIILKKRVKIGTEEEARAKMIIASKKHKYDPEYKTLEERAALFGISGSSISIIDTMKSWGHLPRPLIKEFPRPPKAKKPFVWTYENAVLTFEKIKSRCKYSEEVNKFTGTPCLEWHGGLNEGRPTMRVDGRRRPGYVFACEFGQKRQKREGEMVCHSCNNPICCEPTHLKFGTAKENAADALRFAESKQFVINYEKAREIRHLYSGGDITQKELANQFNIKFNVVNGVVNNRTWIE